MKKITSALTALVCVWLVLTTGAGTVLAADLSSLRLLPGGFPFGVRVSLDGVMVVGFAPKSPAQDAGLCKGDVISAVDGQPVTGAADVSKRIASSGGRTLTLTVQRRGERSEISFVPVREADGFRAGILIRDSTAGIGTVTFLDPETGVFAGLGHGICDGGTGDPVPLDRGFVSGASISGILKGKPGEPGELRGSFAGGKNGTLIGNNECGVFGVFAGLPPESPCETVAPAPADEVREGPAELLCTIDGSGVRRYAVMLSAVDRTGRDTRNFVVTVTDPDLLTATGGVIQGMSGSPILQDGRLVGAVTHVFISDPTRGYGIFIENMLDHMPEKLK